MGHICRRLVANPSWMLVSLYTLDRKLAHHATQLCVGSATMSPESSPLDANAEINGEAESSGGSNTV